MSDRDALIEAMAQALCGCQQPAGAWARNESDGYRNIFRNEAIAQLAAIFGPGAALKIPHYRRRH